MRHVPALALTLAAAALLALHSGASRATPISATIVAMTAVSGPAVASGTLSGGRPAPRALHATFGALALSGALLGPLTGFAAPPTIAERPRDMSHYSVYVASGAISATVTTTATVATTATAVLTTTPTITPTATADFSTPTPTITPTLAPEWGVDALCRCHVPPLPPGSPECERLKAEYVRDVLAAWATQTTLARGTDTPTPTPSDTPIPTATPTLTPIPTDEPTPTLGPILIVPPTETPTPAFFPCRFESTRCGTRLFVPFAGRGRRR